MSKRFPGRRLSPLRLMLLFAVLAGMIFGGKAGVNSWQDSRVAQASMPWFASYVDVTAAPIHPFETPSTDVEKNVVLSFIVAQDPQTCQASWGTYYSLDEAHLDLDLDRRIARLRQSTGEIVVSFGGEANFELALACNSVKDLKEQYQAVLDRYDPAVIDLDIEGEALADLDSRSRRVEAVAQLQAERETALDIWLTLPVGADGLTPDGVAVVREFLAADVQIAGINAMTMNFVNEEARENLAEVITESLVATHRQLRALYADSGMNLGDQTLWRKIGATPMIGQNTVVSEVFSLDDARELHDFSTHVGLGRMSMWSANRDRSCSEAYSDLSVVSESCSGINQGNELFSEILGEHFIGTPDGTQESLVDSPNVHPESLIDDPTISPYPIWDPKASYPEESRVVWRHQVYIAKWWTSDDQPDDPTVSAAVNPWQLVGPVLPDEEPVPIMELPVGFFPQWDPAEIYEQGERRMLEGVAFEAKWWTQGDNPVSSQADPGSSPWRVLTQEEIASLIEAQ